MCLLLQVITVGINTVRELCMRVPLAMDSTLLADLIEYRKDRDRGVVAASRSLLQLYRERMPSMLPKKHRGRGMDGDAAPAAYGQVQLANGVDGVELLAAREARLAAKGVTVDSEAPKEWEARGEEDEDESGSESDDELDDDELEDEEGSGEEVEGEEGSGEEEEVDDEAMAALEAELAEEGEDGEDDEDDEDGEDGDGQESDDEEEAASGEEEEGSGDESGDGEEEDSESDDELDDAAMAAALRPPSKKPRPASAAGSTSSATSTMPRLDATRLLTPKDFERIQRLKAQRAEASQLRGAKRKRAEALIEAEAEAEAEALSGQAIEGEVVDEMDIRGVQAKRAATREEKLASTLAGREDRGKFGGGKGKKTGGKSNKEKRKNNPFMMTRKSRAVRTKEQNREAKARRQKRLDKKMQRGKVRR